MNGQRPARKPIQLRQPPSKHPFLPDAPGRTSSIAKDISLYHQEGEKKRKGGAGRSFSPYFGNLVHELVFRCVEPHSLGNGKFHVRTGGISARRAGMRGNTEESGASSGPRQSASTAFSYVSSSLPPASREFRNSNRLHPASRDT